MGTKEQQQPTPKGTGFDIIIARPAQSTMLDRYQAAPDLDAKAAVVNAMVKSEQGVATPDLLMTLNALFKVETQEGYRSPVVAGLTGENLGVVVVSTIDTSYQDEGETTIANVVGQIRKAGPRKMFGHLPEDELSGEFVDQVMHEAAETISDPYGQYGTSLDERDSLIAHLDATLTAQDLRTIQRDHPHLFMAMMSHVQDFHSHTIRRELRKFKNLEEEPKNSL